MDVAFGENKREPIAAIHVSEIAISQPAAGGPPIGHIDKFGEKIFMWRIIMFLKRLPSAAAEDGLSGWLEKHTPVLLDRLKEGGSLNRASFNEAARGELHDWPSVFDGSLELRFDEFLPAAAALSLLQNNSTILKDAARWLDLDGSPSWIGKARPFLDKPGTEVKLTVGAQVAGSWNGTEKEAQIYWRDVHTVIGQGDPRFWNRLSRYTQIHGFRFPEAVNHMPIAAEIGAASFDDLNEAFATEYYRTTIRPDEMTFVSPEGMLVLASSQEVVLYERPVH